MSSKQPLRQLRRFLYPVLLRWVQSLAPAPLEMAAVTGDAGFRPVESPRSAAGTSTEAASAIAAGGMAAAPSTAAGRSGAGAPAGSADFTKAVDGAKAVDVAKAVEAARADALDQALDGAEAADGAEAVDIAWAVGSGEAVERDEALESAEPGDATVADGSPQGEPSARAGDSGRPGSSFPMPFPSVVPTGGALRFADERAAFCPGQRQPLSVEEAVLAREMSLLKREAADALAALGAAHALVTSARLAQVQHLRPLVEKGEVPAEALKALAADYQGWQNDQVRLFDALALVMKMQVPPGRVLDQVDPALQEQARQHLASLSVEYQRRQLQHQIKRQGG